MPFLFEKLIVVALTVVVQKHLHTVLSIIRMSLFLDNPKHRQIYNQFRLISNHKYQQAVFVMCK